MTGACDEASAVFHDIYHLPGFSANMVRRSLDESRLRIDTAVEEHTVTEFSLEGPQVHAVAGRLDSVKPVETGLDQVLAAATPPAAPAPSG